MSDRSPSHPAVTAASLANPNAELALLGAALRASPEQRAQMCVRLREEWFTGADRVLAWRVIADLISKSLPVAASLVEDGLRAAGAPEAALRIVEDLGRAVPSAEFWAPLADRVHGYYVRRQGQAASLAALRRFEDPSVPHMEALESAESALFALHSANMGAGMRHVSVSMAEAVASIQESIQHRGHVTGGLASGFTDIDRINIKGLRPGHVWIVSAPPGGGKTVFLMKMLWNIATGSGDYREFNHPPAKAGVFSLEMSDVQLAERLLIRLAEIEINKLDRGMVSREEKKNIEAAIASVRASQLYLEFCPGATIQELRVKARYAVMRYGLQIIGVDYAQLIGSSSKDARGNRTQTMMDVSLGLKLLAQECGVPVVVLAQPKQEYWGRRADLSALAETSQLAKDADLVGMLGFWDKLAGEKKEGGAAFAEPDDPEVFAYFDVVKNRHGPNTSQIPPLKLRWERDFFNFVSTCEHLNSNNRDQHQKQ